MTKKIQGTLQSGAVNKNGDFYKFAESEIESLKTIRSSGTVSNYRKLINTMKRWKPSLSFKNINLDFIKEFHQNELNSGNVESTIYKKHANLKFLIGLAMKKELMDVNPYRNFPIKKRIRTINRDFLTESEVKMLQETFDKEQYAHGKRETLRQFLFSCYTGISFCEFSKITYGDIKSVKISTGESYSLLVSKRKKTSVQYRIPLVSPAVLRLVGEGEANEKIFTPLTNDSGNRYLKEIIKELHINKNITFNRALHSFVTIVCKKDMKTNILQAIMGHSNREKNINIIDNETIILEMKNAWFIE